MSKEEIKAQIAHLQLELEKLETKETLVEGAKPLLVQIKNLPRKYLFYGVGIAIIFSVIQWGACSLIQDGAKRARAEEKEREAKEHQIELDSFKKELASKEQQRLKDKEESEKKIKNLEGYLNRINTKTKQRVEEVKSKTTAKEVAQEVKDLLNYEPVITTQGTLEFSLEASKEFLFDKLEKDRLEQNLIITKQLLEEERKEKEATQEELEATKDLSRRQEVQIEFYKKAMESWKKASKKSFGMKVLGAAKNVGYVLAGIGIGVIL